jgi:hypothetical protein
MPIHAAAAHGDKHQRLATAHCAAPSTLYLQRSSAGLRSVGKSTALQSVREGADQRGYVVVEHSRRSPTRDNCI